MKRRRETVPIAVPDPVLEDLGSLLGQLFSLGFVAVDAVYARASFGNYYVDLRRDPMSFRLIRDRGQYIIDAPIERLKALGIFRAYDSREEFAEAVFSYVRHAQLA